MAAKPDDVESAAAGGAVSGSSDDATNAAPPSSSSDRRGGDKRNAKRMLNFQKDHARRFALEPVARDTETGVVTSVVCLFCKHFGREERAGKKRKATTNFKYFKHSFRTDQYMQHHLSQHPRNWAKYDAASDQDKRVFFPLASSSNGSGGVATLTDAAAEALVEDGSKRSKHAKIAAAASMLMNRGDEKVSFDVKKAIVDLIVGELLWRPQGLRSCNLFSTNMRLRAVKKSGVTGDGDGEGGDAEGNDEEMEEAVHGHVPSARQMYYIAVRHRAQLDLAVDFMASGQTYRQIARALSAIVKRTDVDAFMSAAEEEVTDLVRLTSAVSLNSVSKLLDKSWAFSVWMHTAAHDVQRPYLDIRLRLYNSSSGNGKIHNFHLIAIPLMEHQSEEKMYLTFEKAMDAVFPPWRGYLIGLGSDGDAKISSDRVSELMTRIQQEASNPVYRTWCGSHQLDRTMKQFYSALLGGTFVSSFKTLVAYIRSQEHLVLEMGHPPSLVATNPWLAMGKDTKWITDKRVRLRKHLDEEKPAMAAPDDVWWVAFFIANWVAVRANETFKKLQNKHLVVSQQVALMQEFATDLIQNFHIQGPFTSTSALRLLESQTKDQYFPSRQGEYAISKSSMREFMSDLGVFVNTIVSRVDPVTLDIVFENLATCLATLVESLLGLSVGSHDHNNNATDVLPPVLPRELAALSGREFASLLERHSDRVRMFFSEEEMDVIDQEHQELRRAATKEKALKAALTEGGSSDENSEITSFEYAWAQTGGRFKALQHFAGGLATVFPRDDQTPELLDVPSMSDRENSNVCWRMLPMIDFSLEGTLHAQQFHKLQEILQEGRDLWDPQSYLYMLHLAISSFFRHAPTRFALITFEAMQFFSQHHGKEDLATEALVASMRSLKMCDHLSAFDAREHQQWCAKILEPHVTVRVGEPESRGSYLKKHTTFLVTQETSQQQIYAGVRRRFSDFEWLHSVLHARYVGMLVPSLPEKTKNVLQSDSFLQSRIRGLTMFLEHVVQSPYMRNDESVARFFTATDEHAWDTAKKETAVMENAGPGHLRWLMRITSKSIPDSAGAENEIAAFKKQVEQIERSLGDISGCTKRMAEKSAALSKDTSNLHTLFNSWKAVEVATTTHHQDDDEFIKLLDRSSTLLRASLIIVHLLQGEYFNALSCASLLVAAAVHGWSQVMRFEPAIYELLLHESIKYLLHQVKDMKELLGARDQALQLTVAPQQGAGDPTSVKAAEAPSSSSSHPALSKASSTFAAAASSASIFASRFMTTEPSTEELETQQKRACHLCDLITRALISEEIERFRKSKFTALNELMGHFACAKAQLTKRALVQSTKQILDATAAHADSSADAY